MEGIALGKPPLVPKVVMLSSHAASNESASSLMIAAVAGGILLLYCLSRLIALQRRVRDIESRPPVDDIVMRGMIRQEVTAMLKQGSPLSAQYPALQPSQGSPAQQKGPLGMGALPKPEKKVKKVEKQEAPLKEEVLAAPKELVEVVSDALESPLEVKKTEETQEVKDTAEIKDADEAKVVVEENASKKKVLKKKSQVVKI